MERLIPLDDARCRDPRVAGHKAAELARAAAAEMPVLPGWVLPLGGSAAALAAGGAAARGGSGAAGVLAVSSAELDETLRSELTDAVRALGGSAIVRSSTPVDDDPRWSGALATYLEVGEDDVVAAVRGCWASAFSRDARARGERLGVDPAAGGVAVLIQPWVAFASGGVAAFEPDGWLRVSVAVGPPGGLLAGRESGTSFRMDPDRPDAPSGVPEGIEPATAEAVARLALAVRASLGDDAIEWGETGGRVSLLQARRSGHPGPARDALPLVARRRTYPPVAARLALAAAACPGPLGEAWVLPWALALDTLPPPAWVDVPDAPVAVEEAAGIAETLASAVWEVPRDRLAAEVEPVFRAVLGPHPEPALARLSDLRPPDPGTAARLLGTIAGLGARLRSAGLLADEGDVWRLTVVDLRRAALGGRVVPARGPGRWEPFGYSVARDRGRTVTGRPASPGTGAAFAHVVDVAAETPPPPRRVLVVPTVVPQIASLLWDAAGLVADTGSEGAHLFEVARSLGVPAVVGVAVPGSGDRIVAVNGDDGSVSALEARAPADRAPRHPLLDRRTG